MIGRFVYSQPLERVGGIRVATKPRPGWSRPPYARQAQ